VQNRASHPSCRTALTARVIQAKLMVYDELHSVAALITSTHRVSAVWSRVGKTSALQRILSLWRLGLATLEAPVPLAEPAHRLVELLDG
jgi:hypothetical protein